MGTLCRVQETHEGRGAESVVLDPARRSPPSPMNTRGKAVGAHMEVLDCGRRLATFSGGHCAGQSDGSESYGRSHSWKARAAVCVHIEGTDTLSSAEVLRAVGHFVEGARHRREVVSGGGDLNFDLANDRVDKYA
eukprot:2445101-Amphidinium_carterae.1